MIHTFKIVKEEIFYVVIILYWNQMNVSSLISNIDINFLSNWLECMIVSLSMNFFDVWFYRMNKRKLLTVTSTFFLLNHDENLFTNLKWSQFWEFEKNWMMTSNLFKIELRLIKVKISLTCENKFDLINHQSFIVKISDFNNQTSTLSFLLSQNKSSQQHRETIISHRKFFLFINQKNKIFKNN